LSFILKPRRYFVRSVDLAPHLDLFLVAAVGSVIGNRVFLVITGYPQVGNGTLHISHAIWGALMMAIAIIIAVTYLTPGMRTVVALLGGVGFGFFVDELGKFITRDVNYFFKPTFSLIYIIFVTMFFAFRAIERKNFGPNEGVLNALEALKSAAVGRLDETGRRRALDLLRTTNPDGGMAGGVAALLDEVTVLPPHEPPGPERAALRARDRYFEWTKHRSFTVTVITLFLIRATASVVVSALIVFDDGRIKGFSDWMLTVSVVVATALTVVGVAVLPRSRERAYQWFDWGLLVSLLITQIFVFEREQLLGTIILAVTLIYWVLLRSAIRAEQARPQATAEKN
jgi:hypothetical protein